MVTGKTEADPVIIDPDSTDVRFEVAKFAQVFDGTRLAVDQNGRNLTRHNATNCHIHQIEVPSPGGPQVWRRSNKCIFCEYRSSRRYEDKTQLSEKADKKTR